MGRYRSLSRRLWIGGYGKVKSAWGALTAGISLLRGDYYGALSGVMGMCCPGGGLITRGIGMMSDANKTIKKAVTVLQVLKAGAIALNAAIQGGQQLYDLGMLISSGEFDMTNPDHLSMITSTVQSFYTAGSSAKNACDTYKDMRTQNNPDANTNSSTNESNNESTSESTEQNTGAQQQNGSNVDPKNVNGCGDPIDAVTGSQKITQTDLLIRDIAGTFILVRTYESIHSNENGLLGSRWFLNIGSWIKVQDQEASIMMPDMHAH